MPLKSNRFDLLFGMSQRVLFVCLGNICRSPAAEAVFLNQINDKGIADQFFVDSAGTGPWHAGRPADSRMRLAAERRGILIKSIARQITVEDLKNFDLILTMDDDNYEHLRVLASEAGLEDISKIRPMLSFSSNPNITEVPDPYYGGEKGFDKVLDLLDDACVGLLSKLIPDHKAKLH